jgi:hypothetical protein
MASGLLTSSQAPSLRKPMAYAITLVAESGNIMFKLRKIPLSLRIARIILVKTGSAVLFPIIDLAENKASVANREMCSLEGYIYDLVFMYW